MRVCTYLESKEILLAKTGILSAYRNHQRALAQAGIPYTEDPTQDYDILHLHWLGPKSFYHFRRARRCGVPVVITAHSTAETSRGSVTFSELVNPLVKGYLRYLYDHVDLVVAPSPYTKDRLRDYGIRRPIEVISNGVDRTRFCYSAEARAAYRRRFGLGLKGFTVMSAGQVIPRKGVTDFLDVAEALPQYEFVWLGDRLSRWMSYYPRMHRRLENTPPNVKFPGFCGEIHAAYSAADLLFFPSYEENQPMVVLEAASLGLPMVVRDIPAYRGWLRDGEHCLKGTTVGDFIRLIESLAGDAPRRARLSQALQALAEAHRLERVGARYRAVYQALLSSKGKGKGKKEKKEKEKERDHDRE